MKLVMTLLVRDEEDIVRANIDYHLAQGVDFILATDNLSQDRTAEILREYERSGQLSYISEVDDTYSQHVWVTRMARDAHVKFGADWVINSDADEFWWPRFGNLKETLARVPPENPCLLVGRCNFVVERERSPGPFYACMTHREVASFNALGNPLPPKLVHRGRPMIEVAQGNHWAENIGPGEPATGLMDIMHFPVRSHAQLKNKIAKGGAAYARNTALDPSIGDAWRTLHRRLSEDGDLHAYFATVEHDAWRLAARIAAREVIKDTRLADFFARMQRPGTENHG